MSSVALVTGLLLALLAVPATPASAQGNVTFPIGWVEMPLYGPDAWAEDAGSTLPPGLSFRPDPPPWAMTAVATVSGVATTPGTYAFNLLRNGLLVPYTVRISPLTLMGWWNVPHAFVGQPYSVQFTAVGAAGGVVFTPTPGTLPPGLTLDASGLLSGTPTTSGFYDLRFNVTDGIDTVWFGLGVSVYSVRISTDGMLPAATQNVAYVADVDAEGGTGVFSFQATTLPSGLSIDASTGVISGTPTGAFMSRFDVTATDTDGVSYTKRMSLLIAGAPPMLPSVRQYGNRWEDCSFGSPCSRGVHIESGGTPPFSWSASGLPPGMSVRFGEGATDWWINPGDGEIWGTPTEMGTFQVTLTVTDSSPTPVSVSNTFELKVSPLGMFFRAQGGFIDEPYLHTFRVLGGRAPYTAALIGGRLPVGLVLDANALTLSGTPAESGINFNAYVQFTDADGRTHLSDNFFFIGSATSTITINTGNDLGFVTEGVSFSRQFSACCVPSQVWSIAGGALPAGVSLSGSGLLSGTPQAGSSGTYMFLGRVEDETNADNVAVQQFTLRVSTLSITTSSLPYGNVGTAYSQSLQATGGVGITWTLEPLEHLPPGLALSSAGVLSGTPTSAGRFEFRVRATSGAGATTVRRVTLDIYPAGAAPPLSLPSLNASGPVGRLYMSLVATGGAPPYRYELTPGASAIPGMRVQDGPPLPTFTAAGVTAMYLGVITTPGTYTTSIRVTDSAGATFDRSVTITAMLLHLTSQPTFTNATVGVPYSFTLAPYGGTLYTWGASSLPAGLTIDGSGQISGTPAVAGTFSPRISLTDVPTGRSFSWTMTLTVDPFAIATGGELPVATAGAAYNQTLSAPGCAGTCTWTLQGSLPSGISLSSGGTLSGTPTRVQNGSFTVQVSGDNGTVRKVFLLRVVSSVPLPLVVATTTVRDTTIGNAASIGLFARGGTAPYTWSVDGALPPGVSLRGPGEALGFLLVPGITYIAGRPLEVGVFPFTVTVTDSLGATAMQELIWRVSPLGFEYTSLPIAGNPLTYLTPYTQPLLGLGGTGSFSWSSAVMPPGLALDAAGIVTGAPTNTGSFTVLVEATDTAAESFAANVTFTVSGSTDTTLGFASGPDLGTFRRGSSASFNVSATGGKPPYTLTVLSALPPGFVLNGTTLVGVALVPGVHSFTLHAADSLGNFGVRTFTLTVFGFAVLSGTADALPDGSVGVAYSHAVRLVGEGGGVTWTVASGSVLPDGLGLSAAGLLSGTPTTAGAFSFSLRATDATGASSDVSATLRVSNIAVTDDAILPNATFGVPYAHTLTAAGGGSPKVWSATGLPAGLSISSSTGTISGTPTNQFSSASNVLVTVTDGLVARQRRFALSVVATIPAVLDVPLAGTALADAVLGQQVTYTLSVNGGAPPYTWQVAMDSALPPGLALYSGSTLPSTATPGGTVLAGLPTTAGTYAFDLIVTDGAGSQARRTFTVTVTTITITTFTLPAATSGSAYSHQLIAVAGMAPYAFSMTPTSAVQDMLPPGMTLSDDGLLAGIPTSTGTYRFNLHVEDADGAMFSRSMTLTVRSASGLTITTTNPADGSLGRRFVQTLNATSTSGAATYSWSVVGGALPPGVTFVTDPAIVGVGVTQLGGQPTAAGVFTYTLRATNTAAAADVGDHLFTARVSPMQLVQPALPLINTQGMPAGHVGEPYAASLKVAGGMAPYTFAPSGPVPPGLTLDAAGNLSGLPQAIGNYSLAFTVTDDAGSAFTTSVGFVVTASGVPSPLLQNAASPTVPPSSVGTPYVRVLDGLIRGGVAPYVWTIDVGSNLPPGLEILRGGSGVPDHLAGIPTAAGDYAFSLVATDAAGQSLTIPITTSVEDVGFTLVSAPRGLVGVPYSLSLGPIGGAPPYVIQPNPTFDLPVGLTLTNTGVLSGTPLSAGHFVVSPGLTDSVGNVVGRPYRITIDDAAGEAPAVSFAPNPIAIYFEQGSAAPLLVPVGITSSSGARPFTLNLAGAPWASVSAAGGTTPATVTLTVDPSSLGVGTYFGLLGLRAPGSASVLDIAPVILTVAAAPPCAFGVSPATASAPASGTAGGFEVATGTNCAWSAVSSDPSWLTVTSAPGSGSGAVLYSVAAHGGAAERTATITVNGAIFRVTQFGARCSFTISPEVLPAQAAGGTGSIAVTAGAACGGNRPVIWTASGLDATPSSGKGNGLVTVTIPPNGDPAPRVLTATIAGRTLTVNQSGVACAVALSASGAAYGSGGGSGSVTVTAPGGCPYSTVVGPSWVTVTSGGSGTGSATLLYSLEPNSTTVARTGTLVIGGESFAISQAALACSATLDTSSLGSPFGASGGAGSIGVVMNGPNCSWTASSAAAWASVAPSSSAGSGTVVVSVSANPSATSARSTSLTVAGQTIALNQSAIGCSYSLLSSSGSVPAPGGAGSAGVVAPADCAWTAATDSPAWLTISSSGSGGGSGSVGFVAQPNLAATPRVGTLTIAGLAYTVNQAAAECSYTLSASGITVAADGATGSFDVSAATGDCAPTVVSFAGWLLPTLSFSGMSGSVSYTVSPNASGLVRSGVMQVGDRTFTVTQLGSACAFSLNAYGAGFTSAGGAGSVLGSPSALGCPPVVAVDLPTIVTLGSLTGPIGHIFTQEYTVSPFVGSLTPLIRRAKITFGGQSFVVKQTSW